MAKWATLTLFVGKQVQLTPHGLCFHSSDAAAFATPSSTIGAHLQCKQVGGGHNAVAAERARRLFAQLAHVVHLHVLQNIPSRSQAR